MKKVFLLISLITFVLIGTLSVSALENSMTNTTLISNTNGYTFECVITPSVTTSCIPIIAMYDSDDALCGVMYGDVISLNKGTPVVKTFKVNPNSSPSSVKLMLWKSDGSLAPLCGFEQVPTALYSEKFGMITELYGSGDVEVFSTDGTRSTYTLADNVVLSHGSTVMSNKASATSYIDSLKFSYYTRSGVFSTLWKIFQNEITCYKDTSGSAKQVYTYPDFFTNYTKRVVRFLASGDGKISSIAFVDDKLFKKLSSTATYTGAFYTLSDKSFNDKTTLLNDAKILSIPAKYGTSVNDYAVKSPSDIKNGNYYHAKIYTTSAGKQIVLITHMYTDAEAAIFNKKPIHHINTTLNGNGSTIKGINNYAFNITLTGQSDDNNDIANDAVAAAMEYVAIGLQGALDATYDGYVITPEFVKSKFKAEISAAREQLNIIKQLDEDLGLSTSTYYSNLENEIPKAIGNEAVSFLKDYFLGN